MADVFFVSKTIKSMSQAGVIYVNAQLDKYANELDKYKEWGDRKVAEFHTKSPDGQGVFDPLPEIPNVTGFLTATRSDLRKFSDAYAENYGLNSLDEDEDDLENHLGSDGPLANLLQRARDYTDGVGAEDQRRSSEGLHILEEARPMMESLAEELDALEQANTATKSKYDFLGLQKIVDDNTSIREVNIKRLRDDFDPSGNTSVLAKEQAKFDAILGQPSKERKIESILYRVMKKTRTLPATQVFDFQKRIRDQYQKYQKLRSGFLQELHMAYQHARATYEPQYEEGAGSGPQNRYESIDQLINEVQGSMDTMLHRYTGDINALSRLITDVKLYRQEADIEEGNIVVPGKKNIVKITDKPVVQIFELVPPPAVDITQNFTRVQREIQQKFQMFQWSSEIKASENMECKPPFGLNMAQKLSYHYMNPYNQVGDNVGVNVMLAHSAGSGKTCTGQLISSIFARAGYTVLQVSKQTLKHALPKEAVASQCDFNVQQYTRGLPAVKVVIDEKVQEYLQSNPGTELPLVEEYVKEKLAGGTPTPPGKGRGFASTEQKPVVGEDDDEFAEFASLLGVPEGESDEEYSTEDKQEVGPVGPLTEAQKKQNKKIFQGVQKYILKDILGTMGVVQITADKSVDALSYNQFGRFNSDMQQYVQTYLFGRVRRKYTKGGPRSQESLGDYLRKHQEKPVNSQTPIQREREQTGDLLRKCFVIIDEAHKLITNPPDANQLDKVNFRDFRQLLWDSYRISKKNSVRVCLLTATPVAEHPLDLINLATLLAPEALVKKLGFGNYYGIGSIQEKRVTEKRFMEDHYDHRKGRFKNPANIQELLNGRISYFNYSGDASRFAQPSVQDREGNKKWAVNYVPVQLSVYQANMSTRCFPERQLVGQKDGKFIENGAQGYFTYNKKTGVLSIAQGVPTVPAAYRPHHLTSKEQKDKEALKGIAKKKVDCLMQNALWPVQNERSATALKKEGVPDIKSITNVFEMPTNVRKEFFTDRVLRDYSPIIRELLRRVESRKDQGQRELLKVYRPNMEKTTRFSDRMVSYKQYIFTDNVSSKYGVGLIAKFMETLGYEVINKGNNTADITPPKRPYMGMMVFDTNVRDTKVIDELVDVFNAPDNVDGKHCALFINSGRFKEGISLQDVRFAHIVGMVMTHADLVQAVARAIRNCSRRRTPYMPGRGWTIGIDVYSPSFPHRSDTEGLHPLQLLEGVNPDSQIAENAKRQMNAIMQEGAYDRLLLAGINNASAMNEQAVQLWKNKTAIQSRRDASKDFLETNEDVISSVEAMDTSN